MPRTSPPTGPVDRVAPTFPGAVLDPAVSVDDLYTRLTKPGELRRAGLLTEDEFAQQKARLLG